MNERWDKRFLALAEHIAGWSRDPSTKCGAVITDGKRIVSVGFNGFPAGVIDAPERYEHRETKLHMIVHAEMNAILYAREPLHGHTLYTWPFPPCARCAASVIQAGIKCCVAPEPSPSLLQRWGTDLTIARQMFTEAGVQLAIYSALSGELL